MNLKPLDSFSLCVAGAGLCCALWLVGCDSRPVGHSASSAVTAEPTVVVAQDPRGDKTEVKSKPADVAIAAPPQVPETADAAATAHKADVLDGSLTTMEAFNAAADAQLAVLKELIADPDEFDTSRLGDVVADNFSTQHLRPANLQQVFADKCITVRRLPQDFKASEIAKSGPAALIEALAELTADFKNADTTHVEFKTFRVTPDGDLVTTRAYFHAAATSATHVLEQTATWRFHWTLANPPRLQRLELEDHEEVATANGQGPLFSDATLAVLGNTAVFRKQLLQGIEHWRNQLPPKIDVDFRGHHGMALGDVNGDGLDDVYLCQPKGLPDVLMIQNADGTLTDISSEAGIQWLDATKSALLIDLDNDGDQDLVLSMKRNVMMMSNDGHAHFTLAGTIEGPRRPHSMTAADYDSDGDLDVFVCGFWKLDVYNADPIKAAFALPTPWHDARNGAPNVLYRNDGDFNFTDVTEKSGLNQNNTRFSHAAAWEDFDNDGDLGLYVANDFGRNNLYRNDDGHFSDVAAEMGVEDQAAGMSVAWSDVNHDGWMDLYVSNMFSSAGNRVTFHRKFQDKLGESERGEFKRHARGNTLFQNRGGKSFTDVSDAAAIELGRWAWSSNFIDLNNDSRDDIFVANGFVTNEDTGDL